MHEPCIDFAYRQPLEQAGAADAKPGNPRIELPRVLVAGDGAGRGLCWLPANLVVTAAALEGQAAASGSIDGGTDDADDRNWS